MSSDKLMELTDANFEKEVLQADVPVLVDFWAEWCMPCKMVVPTIEQLSEEYDGKVKVGQVDTDTNRDIAIKHDITAIPTLMVFKGGRIVRKFVGVQQKSDLKAAIDEALA